MTADTGGRVVIIIAVSARRILRTVLFIEIADISLKASSSCFFIGLIV